MPVQTKDIYSSIDKMEIGLSRYFSNEETLSVINEIKSNLRVDKLSVCILYTGVINFRSDDVFQSVKLATKAYSLTDLPEDIDSIVAKTDLVIFAILDKCDLISRDDREHIRNISKLNANSVLISTEDMKRDATSFAYAKRNLTFVIEDRRNDLINMLSKISEVVELSIFGIINKKTQIVNNIDLLDFAIKELSLNAAAKSIITNGEFLEIQINDVRLLSKQLSVLKSKLSRSFKALSQELDQSNENYFEITNPLMKELRAKVESFNGFQTVELGKNTVLKMSDGFQDDIYSEFESKTMVFIENQISSSLVSTSVIRKEVDNALYSIDVNHKLTTEEPLNKNSIKKLIETVPKGQRDLERSYVKKGLNQLFTDLRAPMFMLMPILMLFMIFKPVMNIFTKISKEDYIDRAVTESNGFPVIKIVGHPRYDKINEIYESLVDDITSEINSKELASSPFFIKGSLVIQYDEIKEKNKSSKRPIIKLEQDAVYILLETDRDEVLQKFELEYLTEAKKKSTSTSAGIGVVIKFIQNLPYAEYILFILLFIVGYFIRKKILEFNKEEVVEALDSKKAIRLNFQSDLERYINSIQMKWKNTQDNWIRNIQDLFQADLENYINQKIDDETKKVQELKILYDKRIKNFKETEKELNDFQNELKKLKQDILSAIRI